MINSSLASINPKLTLLISPERESSNGSIHSSVPTTPQHRATPPLPKDTKNIPVKETFITVLGEN